MADSTEVQNGSKPDVAEQKVRFFKNRAVSIDTVSIDISDEPTTCTDAEPFALQVRDDSMAPEFKAGCIIVIDPTGRATDGSYVLAEREKEMLFRQLRQTAVGWTLAALNTSYRDVETKADLSEIVGVIVQRAGARRSYHKRYA